MKKLEDLKLKLNKFGSPKRAKVSQWFFKTGPGQYGEGDKFLGLSVPVQRKLAYQYLDLSLSDIKDLLRNQIHEYRFVALEILVAQYEKGDEKIKEKIFNFYIKNTKYINNWDLVDTSAEYIVGDYLFNKDKSILFKLAKSNNIWERRISIISTFRYIKNNKFDETLKIAKILIKDKHDLIQKAVGWMLREVGNRSLDTELKFLDQWYKIMPRTMLRYAIERLSDKLRKEYLTYR